MKVLITVPFAPAYTVSKRGVVAYSDALRLVLTTARMRKLAQRGHFAASGLAGEYAGRLRD